MEPPTTSPTTFEKLNETFAFTKGSENFNGDLYKINVDNSSRVDIKLDWTEKGNVKWGTEYLRFENNTAE